MNSLPLPDPSAALFPDAPERKRIEEWLTQELPQALLRLQTGPVAPTIDMAAFRAELDGCSPQAGKLFPFLSIQ